MQIPATLIVGGHGKVALRLTDILLHEAKQPHKVYSLIRNPVQIPELEALGVTPIVQDIETASVSEIAQTLSSIKPDTIVWAAGAPFGSGDRIDKVDHLGAIKVFDALSIAAQAGDAGYRLISISALDVRDRVNRPVPSWYNDDDMAASDRVWQVIGDHMRAKFLADRELRLGNKTRQLKYTMVRPAGLSDEAGHKTVDAGKVHLGLRVSREDVARVVAACIADDYTIGLAFDVAGGSIPVEDAVHKVGVKKIDTFEGYY